MDLNVIRIRENDHESVGVCASGRRYGIRGLSGNGSVAGLPNTPGWYKNPPESTTRVLPNHVTIQQSLVSATSLDYRATMG